MALREAPEKPLAADWRGDVTPAQQRIAEHNNNRTLSIKSRGPWELVYREEFPTRAEAMHREREIKRMKSHTWIEQLVRASR